MRDVFDVEAIRVSGIKRGREAMVYIKEGCTWTNADSG